MISAVAFRISHRKRFPETTKRGITWSGFMWPQWLHEDKCTNMHTLWRRRGANLPSTLVIHHMITSHPKRACVFIKTHLDPDWQAFADNCIIVLIRGFLSVCHGILFTNLPNYSIIHKSIWPYLTNAAAKRCLPYHSQWSHVFYYFSHLIQLFSQILAIPFENIQGHQSASLKHLIPCSCCFTNATVSTRQLFSLLHRERTEGLCWD